MAVASDVKVTDANSRQVLTERHFDLNPSDNKSQHNYTGYPQYNAKGPNALFTSNNAGYQYTTELSEGSSAVEFTYNSLHLLISQKVLTASGPGGLKTSQTQVYCYPVYCPPKMTSWTSFQPSRQADLGRGHLRRPQPQAQPDRHHQFGLQRRGPADLRHQRHQHDHRHHLQLLRAAGHPDGDRHGRVDQRHHRHLHR